MKCGVCWCKSMRYIIPSTWAWCAYGIWGGQQKTRNKEEQLTMAGLTCSGNGCGLLEHRSVLQNDWLAGAGGYDGYRKRPGWHRKFDSDREVWFSGRPPHLGLSEVFPQGSVNHIYVELVSGNSKNMWRGCFGNKPGVFRSHKHHWIRSISLTDLLPLNDWLVGCSHSQCERSSIGGQRITSSLQPMRALRSVYTVF